jgi:hypothetical protein
MCWSRCGVVDSRRRALFVPPVAPPHGAFGRHRRALVRAHGGLTPLLRATIDGLACGDLHWPADPLHALCARSRSTRCTARANARRRPATRTECVSDAAIWRACPMRVQSVSDTRRRRARQPRRRPYDLGDSALDSPADNPPTSATARSTARRQPDDLGDSALDSVHDSALDSPADDPPASATALDSHANPMTSATARLTAPTTARSTAPPTTRRPRRRRARRARQPRRQPADPADSALDSIADNPTTPTTARSTDPTTNPTAPPSRRSTARRQPRRRPRRPRRQHAR